MALAIRVLGCLSATGSRVSGRTDPPWTLRFL